MGLVLGVLASRVLASIVYQAARRDCLVLSGVVLAMALLGLVARGGIRHSARCRSIRCGCCARSDHGHCCSAGMRRIIAEMNTVLYSFFGITCELRGVCRCSQG